MDTNQENKGKNKTPIKNNAVICCKLYISESRNHAALEAIEQAGRRDSEVAIVNKFDDLEYNRVRYTIVSDIVHDTTTGFTYSPMRQTLLKMVEAAFDTINLERHSGTHPRIGVVDHIGFHPLAQATLEDAAHLAKSVAADIGNELQVPVFLYEAAHPTGKPLDTIRRELGYYRPNSMGIQWAGWAIPEILPVKPDEGPVHVKRARGMSIIGASPWVENYNVPVMSTDVPTVRRIARMVSARGGGLPAVQALGLVHGDDSTEITCMLLDPNRVGPDHVQSRVELFAAEEGLAVGNGYFTDISQDMIVERYLKLLSSN